MNLYSIVLESTHSFQVWLQLYDHLWGQSPSVLNILPVHCHWGYLFLHLCAPKCLKILTVVGHFTCLHFYLSKWVFLARTSSKVDQTICQQSRVQQCKTEISQSTCLKQFVCYRWSESCWAYGVFFYMLKNACQNKSLRIVVLDFGPSSWDLAAIVCCTNILLKIICLR